ncbi:hypothetical protein OAJ27_00115 [bacterium]|nr:hypothetical protein [bacterium]
MFCRRAGLMVARMPTYSNPAIRRFSSNNLVTNFKELASDLSKCGFFQVNPNLRFLKSTKMKTQDIKSESSTIKFKFEPEINNWIPNKDDCPTSNDVQEWIKWASNVVLKINHPYDHEIDSLKKKQDLFVAGVFSNGNDFVDMPHIDPFDTIITTRVGDVKGDVVEFFVELKIEDGEWEGDLKFPVGGVGSNSKIFISNDRGVFMNQESLKRIDRYIKEKDARIWIGNSQLPKEDTHDCLEYFNLKMKKAPFSVWGRLYHCVRRPPSVPRLILFVGGNQGS